MHQREGQYYCNVFSVPYPSSSLVPPLLLLLPQALKIVRHSGLMPFVVFIASPRLERLHITRRVGSEKQKRRLGSSSSPVDLDDAQVYTVSWHCLLSGLWQLLVNIKSRVCIYSQDLAIQMDQGCGQ